MKTVLTFDIANLIDKGARLVRCEDKRPNGVDVHIQFGSLNVGLECTLVVTNANEDETKEELTFTSHSESQISWLSSDLDDLGIKFHTMVYTAPYVKVNILDLLDTHWMIYQLIDKPMLRARHVGADRDYYLEFHNDGVCMTATFDASGSNFRDGQDLIAALEAASTPHEVE